MAVTLFIDYPGDPALAGALRQWFEGRPLDYLSQHPDVVAVETYQPDPTPVVLFDDPPAPPLMVQIDVADLDALHAITGAEAFAKELAGEEPRLIGAGMPRADAFRPEHFPLPGAVAPAPRTAPMSFVVRYYPPVADAAAFTRFYTEGHPPLLARFPGIRNVLCYLPLDWDRPDGVDGINLVIGNEVVFDNVGDLNIALQSPVMTELKAHSREFPSFGHNTHQATRRHCVYRRAA